MAHAAQITLLTALAVAMIACFTLIQPYLYPIAIAMILGAIFHPIHQRITRRLKSKSNLSAFISCALLTFLIVLPILVLSISVIHEGIGFVSTLNSWAKGGGAEKLMEHRFGDDLKVIQEWLPSDLINVVTLKEQMTSLASITGKNLMALGTEMVGNLGSFVGNFLLMLFIFYFVIRDYEKIMGQLRHLLPLSRSQEDALLDEVYLVAKSALLGSFLTALCQGIAGGFILLLAGLPGLFWGAIMAFAALIPVFGTALIWLPATLYLYAIGDVFWGSVVLGWCVLVVGSIDNFLRPLFMQGASSMNTIMVFFSIMGGINVFGLAGLLFGPLIFALSLVLFRLYQQEFASFLAHQDQS